MDLNSVYGELIWTVVGLYVANTLPSWNIQVIIPDRYLLYLPYANIAIIGTCIVRILIHLFPLDRLRLLLEGLSQIISLYALYMLLVIFPFDFTSVYRPEINSLAQVILIVTIGVLCIAILETFYRFIAGKLS